MRILTVLMWVFALSLSVQASPTTLLKFNGEEITEPYWFKESFLDLGDDLE